MRFSYEEPEACVYCGQPAAQTDHVHPRSAHPDEATGHTRELLVPACSECNRIAGAHIFNSLASKREWIHWRLRRRYRRVLSLPTWTDREKAELGPTLRSALDADLRLQWVARRRVAFKCDGRCQGELGYQGIRATEEFPTESLLDHSTFRPIGTSLHDVETPL